MDHRGDERGGAPHACVGGALERECHLSVTEVRAVPIRCVRGVEPRQAAGCVLAMHADLAALAARHGQLAHRADRPGGRVRGALPIPHPARFGARAGPDLALPDEAWQMGWGWGPWVRLPKGCCAGQRCTDRERACPRAESGPCGRRRHEFTSPLSMTGPTISHTDACVLTYCSRNSIVESLVDSLRTSPGAG